LGGNIIKLDNIIFEMAKCTELAMFTKKVMHCCVEVKMAASMKCTSVLGYSLLNLCFFIIFYVNLARIRVGFDVSSWQNSVETLMRDNPNSGLS
jgi:hypothetical protein